MQTKTKHQIERVERARARAERLRGAANGAFSAARAITADIPLGQPILVGHHSERRHRRAIEKADRIGRKACELADAADRAEFAAAGAGRSISSDDPEALDALRAKLGRLEERRAIAKRVNAAWRKGGEAAVRALDVEVAILEKAIADIGRCPWFGVPMPLTNLGAEIRRVQRRIAELKAGPPALERIAGPGWTIEAHPEDNRIAVTFDERQSRERCAELKRDGWRWSPMRGAWIRMLNVGGVARARALAAKLGTESSS